MHQHKDETTRTDRSKGFHRTDQINQQRNFIQNLENCIRYLPPEAFGPLVAELAESHPEIKSALAMSYALGFADAADGCAPPWLAHLVAVWATKFAKHHWRLTAPEARYPQ